jgi:hypothetical protein
LYIINLDICYKQLYAWKFLLTTVAIDALLIAGEAQVGIRKKLDAAT